MKRLLLLLVGLSVCVCKDPSSSAGDKLLHISLRIAGPRAQGTCYTPPVLPKTDYAIWIQDASGNFVKTLAVNTGAVEKSTYGYHTWHLPNWKAAAGATDSALNADLDPNNAADKIPQMFDGITGASVLLSDQLPDTTITAAWDLTDKNGQKVAGGTYYFMAEASNIDKNGVPPCTTYTTAAITDSAKGSAIVPNGTITPGTPTANILGLTAEFR
jgi:hypothetical protein